MHFVRGGPDIPSELVSAQEEGRLAIVCGAGISKPNRLPLYSELVAGTRERLGSAPYEEVIAAIEDSAFDRAMGYLERKYGRARLYEQVHSQLQFPLEPDLLTHRALLSLGKGPDGRLRLVTTNYDHLFEASQEELPFTEAPTLPVPKPQRWDGLVYLHGRLTDSGSSPDDLVMSSADFGRAYLTERWASRFVSDLFASFEVLFVGYSLDDSVMRYLVDAVAAEGKKVYAFAEVKPGRDVARVESEWSLKNVVPIPYDVESDHSEAPHGILHDTLREWASLYEGGLVSRKNVVNEFAADDPASLPEEMRTKLVWAIQDPAVAAHFAELGADTHFGWRHVLAPIMDSAPTQESGRVAFVDGGTRSLMPKRLSRRPYELARWMAAHVADPELVSWVIGRGGRLHPDVERLVGWTLGRLGASVPAGIRKAWAAILSSDVLPYSERGDLAFYDLPERLRTDGPWDVSLRRELMAALSPGLALGRSFTGAFNFAEGQGKKGPEDLAVADLLSVDAELRAGTAVRDIAEALVARADRDAVLADLAWDLTSLLRQTFDVLASADAAGPDFDSGAIVHYSIADDGENNYHRGWTWLVYLNREAFLALLRTDRPRAEALVYEWSRVEYPTFRRMTMYGTAKLLGRT